MASLSGDILYRSRMRGSRHFPGRLLWALVGCLLICRNAGGCHAPDRSSMPCSRDWTVLVFLFGLLPPVRWVWDPGGGVALCLLRLVV